MILEFLAAVLIDKAVHDFGSVDCSRESVCCSFTLTNDDKDPFFIEDVRAACPCLSFLWNKTPVASGSSASISVIYGIEPGLDSFDKSFYVKLSCEDQPRKLSVKGVLVESETSLKRRFAKSICGGSIGVESSVIDFGQIKQGSTHHSVIQVANLSNQPVDMVLKANDRLLCHPSSFSLAPLSKRSVDVSFAPSSDEYGRIELPLHFIPSNGEPEIVPLQAVVLDDFSSLSPAQVNAGPYPRFDRSNYDFSIPYSSKDHTVSIDFKNLSDSTLHIRSVYTDNDLIKSEAPSSVAPGASDSIKLSFDADASDSSDISGTLYLISDSPLKPVCQLRITARKEHSYYDPSRRL